MRIVSIHPREERTKGGHVANPRIAAVTRDHVLRAVQTLRPKEIYKWSVVVEGKEYPVKQLLMEAANLVKSPAPLVTPADFIPHYAKRQFEKLGFSVHYYSDG